MKNVVYLMFTVGIFCLCFNTDVNAAPKKKPKKEIVVNVQCAPLKGSAGQAYTRVSGKVTLKRQKQGFYRGTGTLSVKISEIEKGTILEESDIAVNAHFDDIIRPTLQGGPDPKVETDSQIDYFILLQQNNDPDRPLASEVQTKNGKTYYTFCDLEY